MKKLESFKSLLGLLPPSPAPEEDSQLTERAPVHPPCLCPSDLRARVSAAHLLDSRRRKERSDVKALMSSADSSGDSVFLESRWLQAWKDFLQGGTAPGSIKFGLLLDAFGDVREDLLQGRDFVIVPKEVWAYLKDIYDSEPPLEARSSSITNAVRRSDTFVSFPEVTTPPETEFPALSLLKPQPVSTSSQDVDSRFSEATTSNMYTKTDMIQLRMTRGLVGLANPGLYCFMNASVQLLMSIEPLRDFFFLRSYLAVENRVRKTYCEALADIACSLFSSESGFVRPSRLWAVTNRKFSPHKQHDAQEFIHYMLDTLDSELSTQRRPTKSALVHDWLVGEMRSEVKCLRCSSISCTVEQFLELAVPMEASLKKALKLFCAKETLSAAYDCEKCGKKTDLSKCLRIEKSPAYLILTVKRFKQYPFPQKSNSFVKFHKLLELQPPNSPGHYKLSGVVEHRGRELESGHYVAYCRRGHLWYLYDDKVCSQVLLKDVLSAQAFVLLYRRI